MKKLIVLVEALALATCIVAVVFINPDTVEMMVAASQAANRPEQSAIRKIVIFAQAVGNVAILTANPARVALTTTRAKGRPLAYGAPDNVSVARP